MQKNVLLAAAVLLGACSPDGGAEKGASGAMHPQVGVEEAARLYGQHCASCHGAQGEGQPNWRERRADGRLPAPPHDDSGHTWHHPPEQLFAITKQGMVPPNAPPGYESDMPAFASNLTDEQIWGVLAYIRSFWSDEVRAMYAQRFGS